MKTLFIKFIYENKIMNIIFATGILLFIFLTLSFSANFNAYLVVIPLIYYILNTMQFKEKLISSLLIYPISREAVVNFNFLVNIFLMALSVIFAFNYLLVIGKIEFKSFLIVFVAISLVMAAYSFIIPIKLKYGDNSNIAVLIYIFPSIFQIIKNLFGIDLMNYFDFSTIFKIVNFMIFNFIIYIASYTWAKRIIRNKDF